MTTTTKVVLGCIVGAVLASVFVTVADEKDRRARAESSKRLEQHQRNEKERRRALAREMAIEPIEEARRLGLIHKIECPAVDVDPVIWSGMRYEGKEGTGATAAAYCERDHITIRSANDRRELARYGVGYGLSLE